MKAAIQIVTQNPIKYNSSQSTILIFHTMDGEGKTINNYLSEAAKYITQSAITDKLNQKSNSCGQ